MSGGVMHLQKKALFFQIDESNILLIQIKNTVLLRINKHYILNSQDNKQLIQENNNK